MLFEWTDEFSVGVESIDQQHQVLVALLNQLYDAIETDSADMVIKEILEALIDYTHTHFLVEECLMEVLNYKDYDNHKKEHKDLLKQLLDFKTKIYVEKVNLRDDTVAADLLAFLIRWLKDHILESDKAYSSHFIKIHQETAQ